MGVLSRSRGRARRWAAVAAAVVTGVGAAAAAPGPAYAATRTVRSLADAGPGTLRAAVKAARTGDTIVVPAGTITLKSEIFTDKSITIRGAGRNATVLSGNNVTRVLRVETGDWRLEPTPTFTLQGLTIQLGRGAPSVANGPVIAGGAWIQASNLVVDDLAFAYNAAMPTTATWAVGGGLVASAGTSIPGDGRLSITNSAFVGNLAQGVAGVPGVVAGAGGTARYGGAVVEGRSVAVTDTVFDGNVAKAGPGANVAAGDAGHGGDAEAGGLGVGVFPASFTRVTFVGNAAVGGNGGSSGAGGRGGSGGNATGGALRRLAGTATTGVTFSGNQVIGGTGGAGPAGAGQNGFAEHPDAA